MEFVLFLVCLAIIVIVIISKTRTSYVRENILESMRNSCKSVSQNLHVFIDAGPDELSSQRAMECVCRALDMAVCPENIHIFVIIPTQYFARKSSWDTQLESTCSSQSRYSTFFENNVHLFKLGLPRYARGGLQTVANILSDLETIQESELIVWMPILTRLEKNWDAHVRKDWESVSTVTDEPVLSYPMHTVPTLEQDIEGYLFQREIKSTPCYYFINSFFNLESRSFAKTEHSAQSSFLSCNYPLVTKNSSLKQIKEIIHGEDFQFSYAMARYSIFLGMHSIGFTHRKNTSSVPVGLFTSLEQSAEFREWAEKVGIHCLFTQEGVRCKVMLHGKMGTGKEVSLQEKINKWGTEIKYQTFREALLSEEAEEKS